MNAETTGSMGSSLWKQAGHILCADDEPEVCRVLQRYLNHHNYAVTAVGTAKEALSCLDNTLVNLAVIDVVLPGDDGLELLSDLQKTHPQLPCVIYTGIGFDEEAMQEAKEKG